MWLDVQSLANVYGGVFVKNLYLLRVHLIPHWKSRKICRKQFRLFGHVEWRSLDVVLRIIDQMKDNWVKRARKRPLKPIREFIKKRFRDQ